jgi:hypothetical protein
MPAFRKPTRRETVLLGLLAVAVVTVGWWLLRTPDAAVTHARRAAEAVRPVPRIDLARLEQPASSEEAGRRNLFAFGAAPAPAQVEPPPIVLPTRPAVTAPTTTDAAADAGGAPALPPLNMKYIGSVENSAGVRVAVLLTDRQEVLTGEAGQIVANRYRVARIGLESVDLEDVNTGQSRRIALRGS